MTHGPLTAHAISQFQGCSADNLRWSAAAQHLARLLRRARFLRMCAGQARLYTLGNRRFGVRDGRLVTVCRLPYVSAPPTDDLWCQALTALDGAALTGDAARFCRRAVMGSEAPALQDLPAPFFNIRD